MKLFQKLLLKDDFKFSTMSQLSVDDTDRNVNEKPVCVVCLGPIINEFSTPCGHHGCLRCFKFCGIQTVNVAPLPRCPSCFLPVMWICSVTGRPFSSSIETSISEQVLADASRAEAKSHPHPSCGGPFIYHVATCDECKRTHPNAYDEAMLAVPA